MVVLGHKRGHPPRTGQRRLEKLRFQVTFRESSLRSWEPLLILELGLTWLLARICSKGAGDMPLRGLQQLVWLHLRRPPKWQVMRKQCCALGGHQKRFPRLAVERRVLELPWEKPCAQRKTQMICVNL